MREVLTTNFKYYRLIKGYSQEVVANISGISLRGYQNIETGVTNPSFLTTYRICKSLEISTDDILKNNSHNKLLIQFLKPQYKFIPNRKFNRYDSNLKKLRINSGISQSELAKRAEVNLRVYGKIENERIIPNVFIALKLAKALKVSVERLFILSAHSQE